MLKPLIILGAAALAVASSAQAGLNASGSINYTQASGVYSYDITLNNVGTTNIRTFWYSWIPGQDYMPVAPTSTSGPAGWAIATTHAGAGVPAGYGIRWSSATPLAPGASLSGFRFTSTATPAELLGNSLFFNNPKVGTSWVYETVAPPLTPGSGLRFVVDPVPEPATVLGLAGGLAVLARRRRWV